MRAARHHANHSTGHSSRISALDAIYQFPRQKRYYNLNQDDRYVDSIGDSLLNYRWDMEAKLKGDSDTTIDFLFLSMKHGFTSLARSAGWNTLFFPGGGTNVAPQYRGRIARDTAHQVLGWHDNSPREVEDLVVTLEDVQLWRPPDMSFRITKYSV